MKPCIWTISSLIYIIHLIFPGSLHNHKKLENSKSTKKFVHKNVFFSTFFYSIIIVIDFFLANEKCYIKILKL